MFKLVRYYSIASFLAFLLVAIILGLLYRQVILQDLTDIAESKNVAITRAFSNSLWDDFAPFVTSAADVAPGELVNQPELPLLRQLVLGQMEGLSVVKVKIYDLNGLTVFSTEASQIGEDKSSNLGFLSAKNGEVASELTHRNTFSAFEGTIENRDVFSSYVPVRHNGTIAAVIEVYDDLTPLIRHTARTQWAITGGVFLILSVLYLVLFLIVKRADRIIQQQYSQLATSQQALQAGEENLRHIFSAISDHIYVTEILSDGQRLSHYLSPIDSLTGYKQEQVMTDWNSWSSGLIHPDDIPLVTSQAERFTSGKSSEIEYRLKQANGDTIWVRDSGRVEKDPLTSRLIVYGVVSNITERKIAEEAAYLSQYSIDSATDSIFWIGPDAHILRANQGASNTLGYSKEELLGMKVTDFDQTISAETWAHHWEELKQVGSMTFESKYCTKNGDIIPVEVRPNYFHYNGQAYNFVHARDISDRIQIQEMFAVAHDRALEANRLKSQLLAKVSHELRTPLNVILGYTEMLEYEVYGPISAKQQEVVSEIIDSTKYLTTLVNELLDQAQLDSGNLRLSTQPFNPVSLVEAVSTQMKVLAENKGLALITQIEDNVPVNIMGDAPRLQQVFINLVGNAIKFTEQGSIKIMLYQSGKDRWAVKVSDTGIGISDEMQTRIFDPFTQVNNAAIGNQSGYGLGLSIVKQLIELMHGELSLESQLNKGSTFTVTLPLKMIAEVRA